jgi:hypothetical protein
VAYAFSGDPATSGPRSSAFPTDSTAFTLRPV